MSPIRFREANRVLHGPADPLPDPVGKVETLPVWSGGSMVVSCWRPTWRERLSILVFGRVWLNVLGGPTQPPVSLTGCRDYFDPATEPTP